MTPNHFYYEVHALIFPTYSDLTSSDPWPVGQSLYHEGPRTRLH